MARKGVKPVLIEGSVTATISSVTANQGTAAAASGAWPVKITDGTDTALVTAGGLLQVDGSGATQPVSAVSLPLPTLAATSTIQTDGTQKAIVRGGAKGATVAADITSTVIDADHQGLDTTLYASGGPVQSQDLGTGLAVDVNIMGIGTTITVNTELPSAVSSSTDTLTPASTAPVIGLTFGYTGSGNVWARMKGDATNGLYVQARDIVKIGGVTPAALADDLSSTQVAPVVGAAMLGMDSSGADNLDRARLAKAHDMDSGAGTEYAVGVVLRKTASGGSVEYGTVADPFRTDPTGTTTQPVSGTVAISSQIPGTGATNLGKAEDALHGSGDTGVFTLGIVSNANGKFISQTSDYSGFRLDMMSRSLNGGAQDRSQIGKGYVALAGTSETTVLAAAGASVFHDVTHISVSNRNASAVDVIIRDATAGTTIWRISLPANGSWSDSFSTPVPQATANNNWTAQSTASNVDVTIIAAKTQ